MWYLTSKVPKSNILSLNKTKLSLKNWELAISIDWRTIEKNMFNQVRELWAQLIKLALKRKDEQLAIASNDAKRRWRDPNKPTAISAILASEAQRKQ